MDHVPEPMGPKKSASYGALISIILILFIVIVGAFYVWGKRIKENTPPAADSTSSPQATTTPEATTTSF